MQLAGMKVEAVVEYVQSALDAIEELSGTKHYLLSKDMNPARHEATLIVNRIPDVEYEHAFVTRRLPLKMRMSLDGQSIRAFHTQFFSPLTEDERLYYHPQENVEMRTIGALVDHLFLHLCLAYYCIRAIDTYFLGALKRFVPDVESQCKVERIDTANDPKFDGSMAFKFTSELKPEKMAILAVDKKLELHIHTYDDATKDIQQQHRRSRHPSLPRLARTSALYSSSSLASAPSIEAMREHPDYTKHFTLAEASMYLEHSYLLHETKGRTPIMHPLIKLVLQMVFEHIFF